MRLPTRAGNFLASFPFQKRRKRRNLIEKGGFLREKRLFSSIFPLIEGFQKWKFKRIYEAILKAKKTLLIDQDEQGLSTFILFSFHFIRERKDKGNCLWEDKRKVGEQRLSPHFFFIVSGANSFILSIFSLRNLSRFVDKLKS